MAQVKDSIDVDAPISAVYGLWTQFEQFPKFMSGVESVTQQADDRLHWVVSIAGAEREFDAEITEQTPDQRIAWKSIAGEEHAGVVTFHRLDDAKTRVELQLDWQPEGFVERAGALLQVDDIQIGRDLRRFKAIAEGVDPDTAAEAGWDGDIDRAPDATGR